MNFKIEMTKVNPNNGNETSSDIFSWDIFKSDIIFHWSQNIFDDFYNWHLLISLQKWPQRGELKWIEINPLSANPPKWSNTQTIRQ